MKCNLFNKLGNAMHYDHLVISHSHMIINTLNKIQNLNKKTK